MADIPQLYWISRFTGGDLAIMAAARTPELVEEAVKSWQSDGVEIVVSLLEEREFPNLTAEEQACCEEFGLEFRSFPLRDKTVPPSLIAFSQFAQSLAEAIMAGKSIAIHCRAGIGRSATLAACVLIQLGVPGAEALDMIAEARGLEVPETEAQRQWVLDYHQLARMRQQFWISSVAVRGTVGNCGIFRRAEGHLLGL